MNIYSKFKTDENAETNGVWVDIGDGASVKVARLGNPNHEKIMERLRKPYRGILRTGGSLPDSVSTDIAIKGIVDSILLDWDGFQDENGKDLPYSQEAADKLLREMKDFRELVAFLATEQETFRAEGLKEAAKNSEPPSDGGSSGESKKTSSKT